jgi:hypothetical protein
MAHRACRRAARARERQFPRRRLDRREDARREVVRGIGVLPLFAGGLGLLLLVGSLAATWLREGR